MKILKVDNIDTVQIDPIPINKHSRVTIQYKGYLNLDKSAEISLHYGFGSNDSWENVHQSKMKILPGGSYSTIAVNEEDRINLCFNDNNGRWDNNYGNNWSYEIQ